MHQPIFRLQIVDRAGHVVMNPFNGNSPMERNLVEVATAEILRRGVGFFRSESHVEQDIRDGLTAAIQALKDETRFVARSHD